MGLEWVLEGDAEGDAGWRLMIHFHCFQRQIWFEMFPGDDNTVFIQTLNCFPLAEYDVPRFPSH